MRGFTRMIVASAAAVAVVGCSDSTTGIATTPDERAPVAAADRPSLEYNGPMRFAGFKTSYIRLTARGGSYNIGDGFYTLDVPEHAVCVLGSTYGPDQWDAPCQTLGDGESIVVRATIGFANGGPIVDFSPDLRFSPAANVTLSTFMYAPILVPNQAYFSANPSAMRSFGMYYTADFGVSGATDAARDSSVITHVNLRTGQVWRRVKHFSGYNILAGTPCDPSPNDPDCVEVMPDVVH